MKNIIKLGAGVIIVLVILFVFKAVQFYNRIHTGTAAKALLASNSLQEKTIYNILLLGYGGGNHEGTYLTDSLMVAHVDLKQHKVGLISLPRDIWVALPTKSGADFHEKVNAVYQIGLFPQNYPDVKVEGEGEQAAAELVKTVIGKTLGLPIDNYFAVDFDGFKKAVDIIDGVDVDVIKTFDDYEYPIEGKEKDLCGKAETDLPELEKIATQDAALAFPCRYEHLHFDAGTIHMDGETALKYVRSRHSLQDGSDFGRAARQQRFLEAVRDKVVSFGFITKVIPLLDQMSSYIKTDITLDLMKKLSPVVYQSDKFKTVNIIPSDDNYLKSSHSSYGGYILIPEEGEDQWRTVQEWIKTSIKTGSSVTPTPTPTLMPTVTKSIK